MADEATETPVKFIVMASGTYHALPSGEGIFITNDGKYIVINNPAQVIPRGALIVEEGSTEPDQRGFLEILAEDGQTSPLTPQALDRYRSMGKYAYVPAECKPEADRLAAMANSGGN